MSEPLVSVIMPVYNCELYIEDAIKSILDQTYSNFECIIIDDCSTDSTKKIIKAVNDTRIKLIEKDVNTGYTKSLNYAILIAKGVYLARMDGDDISHPERFKIQVEFLESNPDIIACGTIYKILGGNKVIILPQDHEDIKIELLTHTCFGHPTVVMRKEVLDRHQLYYNVDKEPAEDYDLWVRLLNYGKLHNIQKALLEYRVHKTQVSQTRRETQLKSKLASRIEILKHLNIKFNEFEMSILKKAFLNKDFNYSEILSFVTLKKNLISNNDKIRFFKNEPFVSYLNTLEKSVVVNYFLKQKQFNPRLYLQYLGIKNQLQFNFTLKTNIIVFVKSLFYANNKKYN